MGWTSKLAVLAAAICIAAIPAANAAKFEAKLASQDPATTAKHRGLLKAAELIKERTNGDVEIKVFPSSQLGGGRQMIEGTQLGTIEIAITPAAFLGGFNPLVSVLDIPYILPSDRDVSRKLRNGKFGDAVLDSFRAKGLEPVALWDGGRKQFTSNKPLTEIGDFSGQRFRVMDSKILIEQFAGLKASAIVLQFGELYTALQNGVIDGQENPLDIIQAMKFFEVQKNMLVTDHGAITEVILMNPGWYNKLPENYRASSRLPSRRSRRRLRPRRPPTPISRSSSSSRRASTSGSPTRPSGRSCARRSIRRPATPMSRPPALAAGR